MGLKGSSVSLRYYLRRNISFAPVTFSGKKDGEKEENKEIEKKRIEDKDKAEDKAFNLGDPFEDKCCDNGNSESKKAEAPKEELKIEKHKKTESE